MCQSTPVWNTEQNLINLVIFCPSLTSWSDAGPPGGHWAPSSRLVCLCLGLALLTKLYTGTKPTSLEQWHRSTTHWATLGRNTSLFILSYWNLESTAFAVTAFSGASSCCASRELGEGLIDMLILFCLGKTLFKLCHSTADLLGQSNNPKGNVFINSLSGH